jgi:Protein of unknown function (DUF2752)
MSDAPHAGVSPPPPVRFLAREGPPLGLIFAAIGVVGALAVGLLHLDRLPFPLCYLKLLTGLPCPTCGSTRALGRLFALDVPGALVMNPVTTLAAFAILLWAAADLVLLPQKRALGLELSPRAGRALRIAVVVAVVANWAFLLAAGR